MSGERLRDRKREETRERLLDAAFRLFGQRGYDRTTTAQIAEAAAVTERTLFRHFPSKRDLVLANWHRHAASLEAAMSAQPDDARPIEVVRAGVRAFAERLAHATDQERQRAMAVYGGRLPVLSMLEVVLALESSIAGELGRRLGLSDEDLDVRIVANTSIGVLRASGRAYVVQARDGSSLTRTVSDGIDRLTPLFDALERRAVNTKARVSADGSSPSG